MPSTKKIIRYIIVIFFWLWICFWAVYLWLSSIKNPPEATECVALVHWLGRGPASFTLTAAYLKWEGYKTIRISYPSTKDTIESLADKVWDDIVVACGNTNRINIVTHSLGGILIRQALTKQDPEKLGHVIMLAPPSKGSEIVDTFGDYQWFEWINGQAGNTLKTDKDSIPNQLPSANFSVWIIAGSISFNPLYSYFVIGRDDGKVSIENTKITKMADHIVIPSSHTHIMNNPLSLAEISHFLNHGSFHHNFTMTTAIKKVLSTIF